MSDRRSLDHALEMTPEKLAFVQGGRSSETAKPVPAAKKAPIEPSVAGKPVPAATDAGARTPKPTTSTGKSRKQTNRRRIRANSRRNGPTPEGQKLTDPSLQNFLVPLTTRLHAQTATALRRAYLEQKLHGRLPETKQEIVETAVKQWLQGAGYCHGAR